MRTEPLWLGTGFFWAACTAVLGAQEFGSPYRHLPENTMAVVHVRVEALLKSAWGKAALDEFLSKKETKDSFLKIKTETAIDPFEIEGLTFVVLDPVASSDQKHAPAFAMPRWGRTPPPVLVPPTGPREGPVFPAPILPRNSPPLPSPPPPFPAPLPPNPRSPSPAPSEEFISVQPQTIGDPLPLMIVTTRKAIDRKLFMRKRTDQDSTGNGPGTKLGLQFLNDSTFVLGPDAAVVQFAASTSDKESELGRQLTQQNSEAMIQGGYRLTALFKKALVADSPGAGPLSMVFPLANLTHATFAIDFGKQADVKVRLTAANERQANLAAQSIKTLLALAEAHCEKTVPELEKSLADLDARAKQEVRDEIALAKSVQQMSRAARVEQRQSEVSIALQIDVPARTLLPIVQSIFSFEPNPRLTAH